MQIKQSVTVKRPRDEVWALFQDIPTIAGCMPGAELTRDDGDGAYAGIVSIKLGPFKAAFEGEVQHTPDPATFSGKAEGRGIDKKGGSRSRMTMTYVLVDKADATDLAIDAEVQLSGPVAQFGRPGIVSETAKLLIQQFVANPAGALQAASSLLTNFSGAQAAPVAPAPLATASLAVPNPTTGAMPVANAAAPALSVPSIPGVPLPAGVSLPPNLTSLIPMGEANGIPTLGNSTTVPGAVQPPTPAAPGLGPLFPVSALP